ncbi:putative ABC transport system permease protein [Mycoplasma testudineum]|uniref:Putative ABC transport system permease protein n=1 Tax=Mycoplasma testudineum TaxID=244584 RepID=A0A4R6IFG9_9MOLU|nr:FtsX-like permease family protein [Mycoplasma testudineum]TDO20387.1 putative ABC transport system permease protein [Mycoplasma testudineum]
MKKLFKEAFHSLKNNKFMILLLTIITLLSSGLLTALFNVRDSYINQYRNVETVSKLHDYTVDLDLQANGSLPESGTYLKSETVFSLARPTAERKVLNFNSSYVLLNILLDIDSNMYINTTDLEQYFNESKTSNEVVVDRNNNTITFASGYVMKLYNLSGQNTYSVAKTNYSIDSNTEFSFDKKYFLREIANLNLKNIDNDFLSNVGSIYLNIRTKEASLSVAKSVQWQRNNELLVVEGQNLATILGYKLNSDGYYYFDATIMPGINIENHFINNDQSILNYASSFSGNFKLTYLTTPLNIQGDQLFISQGQTFNIPQSAIQSSLIKTEYLRTNYDFNYNNGNEYTGVYKTIADKINDGSEYQSLKSGYFWKKRIVEYINGTQVLSTDYVLNSNDINQEIVSSSQPTSTSIFQLENFANLNRLEYSARIGELSDTSVVEKLDSAFQSSAVAALRNTVIQKVGEYAGKSNIGYRQTTVLNLLVEDKDGNNQNYSYLFVNTGNENAVVASVVTGVGRLIQESEKNTLNTNDSKDSEFFRKEFVNPAAAGKLAYDMLVSNTYVDPTYLKVKLFWETAEFIHEGQSQKAEEQKIVQIVKIDDPDQKYGVFLQRTGDFEFFFLATKKGDVWVEEKKINGPDFIPWIVENNFSLDATHDGPWAKVNGDLITIPTYLVTIKQDAVVELAKTGKLTIAARSIKDNLFKTSLVTEGFWSSENVDLFVDSGVRAIIENDVGSLIATTFNPNAIPKLASDIIYNIVNNHGEEAFENLFTKIIDNLYTRIESSGSSISEQKKYIKEQLDNVSIFTGYLKLNLFSNLPLGLSIEQILEYIKDPKVFLTIIKNLIIAINWTEYTAEVRDFYNNVWNKYIDDKKTLQTDLNLLLPLLKNLDTTVFKDSFKTIINNIDLNALLNPELENSLYQVALKNNNVTELNQLKSLLIKLQGSSEQSPYENINSALNQFIDIWDVDAFVSLILANANYKDFKFNSEGITYRALSLEKESVLAALISSIVNRSNSNTGNNEKQFKEIIIRLLNLSDAGVFNDIIGYIPDFSNSNKIGIADLGLLGSALSQLTNKVNVNNTNPVNTSTENSTLIITNNNNWNNFRLTSNNFINALSNKETLLEIEKNWIISNIWDIPEITIENYDAIIKKIEEEIAYRSAYVFEQSQNNFATLTNIALNTTADDEIYNQAKNEILKNAPVSIVYEDGNLNLDAGKLSSPLYFLILKLKYAFKNDLDTFKTEYKKIADLIFNSSRNSQTLQLTFEAEFLNLINSYDLYPDTSDNITLETNFKISKSLASNRRLSNELFQKDSSGNFLNSSFNNWMNTLHDETKKLISADPNLFVETMGMWAALYNYHPGVINTFRYDVNNTNTKNLYNYIVDLENVVFSNENVFVRILNDANSSWNTGRLLNLISLSSTLVNPLMNAILPQVTLWFIADIAAHPNSAAEELVNRANLAYIVNNKLINFSSLNFDEIKELIVQMLNPSQISNVADNTNSNSANVIETENPRAFVLDYAYLIDRGILQNNDNSQNILPIFGIQPNTLFNALLSAFAQLIEFGPTVVSYSNSASSVIKLNESFMRANNLTAYTGTLPADPSEMSDFFVKNANEKFIYEILGNKYVIVGSDTTGDLLYPVLDENNLQVNTKYQAIVFVNQYGWDKATKSSNSAIKNYLLVANQTGVSNEDAVNNVKAIINESRGVEGGLEKVYLANVTDPINPERALRSRVPSNLFSAILNFNLAVVIFLLFLMAVAFVFAIRRYINNKSAVFGILVSQGYSNNQIALSALPVALVTTLLGSITGYLIGSFFVGNLTSLLQSFWTNQPTPVLFSFLSFSLALIVPILFVVILTYLSVYLILRKNPLQLMNGQSNLVFANLVRNVSTKFRKNKITTKFSGALFFNSFYRLIWLVGSVVLSIVVFLTSISSQTTFNNSIEKTFENRKYAYKQDLVSPTSQAGAYKSFDPSSINNNVYVPIGLAPEANTNYGNYFAPGFSEITNASASNDRFTNGNPTENDIHIVSKASADILLQGVVTINPWSTGFSQLPASFKSKIDSTLESIATKLMFYQNRTGYKFILNQSENEVLLGAAPYLDQDEKTHSYFVFGPSAGKGSLYSSFYLNYFSDDLNQYIAKPITNIDSVYNTYTNSHTSSRDYFRDFLIDAYTKLYKDESLSDFFISFGGTKFIKETDETYSYASGKFLGQVNQLNVNNNVKIYGYKNNSKMVELVSSSNNKLGSLLEQEVLKEKITLRTNGVDDQVITSEIEVDVYPLIINHVSSKKYGLNVNNIIKYEVDNHVDRFKNKITNPNSDSSYIYFKVVGVNDTYVNDEFITSQNYVNKITGLDTLKTPNNEVAYNGIFTNDSNNNLTNGGIPFYSVSGYYPAIFSWPDSTFNKELYKQIYLRNGILQSSGITESELLRFIGDPSISDLEAAQDNSNYVANALEKYKALYGEDIYSVALNNLSLKSVEQNFAASVSTSLTKFINWIAIISIIISIIILTLISTFIIFENKRNIALFSILGYTLKEKVKLFFGVFAPFLIFAFLVAVGLTFALYNVLDNFLAKSTSISLPNGIEAWHVILGLLLIVGVFIVGAGLAFFRILKIKAISIMNSSN